MDDTVRAVVKGPFHFKNPPKGLAQLETDVLAARPLGQVVEERMRVKEAKEGLFCTRSCLSIDHEGVGDTRLR